MDKSNALKTELRDTEQRLLTELRTLRRDARSRRASRPPQLTVGQRIADTVAAKHGLVAIHHHPISHSGGLDHPQRHRLYPAMGPLPIHPAQPGALVPSRLRGAVHHDEPEPAAGHRSPKGGERFPGQRESRAGDRALAPEDRRVARNRGGEPDGGVQGTHHHAAQGPARSRDRAHPLGAYPRLVASSTWRIFRATVASISGFEISSVPGSRRPWWTMALRE